MQRLYDFLRRHPTQVDGFWALVRQLPDRQAAAVALHYLEDRSVAQIADDLGIAEGTVKVHLSRGRAALAESLGRAAAEGSVPDA